MDSLATASPRSIPLRGGTDESTICCSLNWDREKNNKDGGPIDSGEWTTFDQLESEANRGCEKCAVIHSGIQHYRSTFEGRAKGAEIFRSSHGISCIIPRELREGDQQVQAVSLEFFRDRDEHCPWLPALHRPIVAPTTDCPESFDQLREWIETCEAEHEFCSGPPDGTLPTRILDLGEDSHEQGDLKLRDGGGERGRYATLSHAWGSYQPLRTTKTTSDLHHRNISFHDLPKTFQDAALTCRRLGIRYLWVDSLCIVQDDDEDWQIQSAQMDTIYENSILTIAASSAHNATEGCFIPVPERHAVHSVSWPGTSQGSGAYTVKVYRSYPHFSFWDKQENMQQRAPLLSRAWFYQERYLSRRVVHFTAHELVWECQTVATCQCISSTRQNTSSSSQEYPPMSVINRHQLRARGPKPGADANARDKRDLDPWHLCVRAYSQLSLTYEKDVFPALAGLASRVQLLKPGAKYCAGLWLDPAANNLNDLAWMNAGFPRTRHKRWRAPTWSWASVRDCIPSWGDWIDLDPEHTYAKLLEAKVKPSGLDPNGELRDAHIRVRGPMVPGLIQKATISKPDGDGVLQPWAAPVVIRGEPCRLHPLVRLDVNPELCEPKIVPGSRVYCLRLGKAVQQGREVKHDISLCLRVVDDENGEFIFERIGLVDHDYILDPREKPVLYSVKIQ